MLWYLDFEIDYELHQISSNAETDFFDHVNLLLLLFHSLKLWLHIL